MSSKRVSKSLTSTRDSKPLKIFSISDYTSEQIELAKSQALCAIHHIKMYTASVKVFEEIIGGDSTKSNENSCTKISEKMEPIIKGMQDEQIKKKYLNIYNNIFKELDNRFKECQTKGIDFEEIVEISKFSVIEIGAIENFVLEKQRSGHTVEAYNYQDIKQTQFTKYKVIMK